MNLEQMQNNVRQDIINELPIEAEGYLSKEFTDSVVAATWKASLNSILESGLLEGIEGMKPHVRNVPPSDKQSIEAVCLVQVGYEQCKKDFLENVVKPLYGKE